MKYLSTLTCAGLCAAGPVFAATQGTVIAIGDEWTLSDIAFDGGSFNGDSFAGDRPNAEQLTSNIAGAAGGTNYLIATDNPYAYGADFEAHLGSLSKSVTRVNTQAGFDSNISSADVVFLAGQIAAGSSYEAQLNTFVANGGSVVVSLGTGWWGNAGTEAANWNPFLQAHGLSAGTSWLPAMFFTPFANTDGPTSVDDGVTQLLWGFGHDIDLFGATAGPEDGLVSGTAFNTSFDAIGISASIAPIPLPAGLPLMLAGLGALGIMARRRK